MAQLTRSGLRSEVLNRLGETTGFFTADQINTWLQDGIREVSTTVEPLMASATVNVVANIGEYLLPPDLISIKSVLYGGATKWENMTETTFQKLFERDPEWENDTTAGTPQSYYWRPGQSGDVVGLAPIPSASLSNGLRILYTYYPAAMSGDTATTGFPEWLDQPVLLWAVYRCFLKDRDEPRASVALGEYKAAVNEAIRKLHKGRKDHATRLTPNMKMYRQFYQHSGGRVRLRTTG